MDIAAADLPSDKLDLLTKRLLAEQERRINENRLGHYNPYAKQAEFHAAGLKHRERLLMAGNQLGKTIAGGFEIAMHATGRYPDWWKGRRFDARLLHGRAVRPAKLPATRSREFSWAARRKAQVQVPRNAWASLSLRAVWLTCSTPFG